MKWLTKLLGEDDQKVKRVIVVAVLVLVALALLKMFFGRGAVIEKLTSDSVRETREFEILRDQYDRLTEDYLDLKFTSERDRTKKTTKTPILLSNGKIGFAESSEETFHSRLFKASSLGSRTIASGALSKMDGASEAERLLTTKVTKPYVKKWMAVGIYNWRSRTYGVGPGFAQDLGLVDVGVFATHARQVGLMLRF